MRHLRAAVILTLAVACLPVGACAAPPVGGSASQAAPPPTPSSNDFTDSLEHTRSLATATVLIDLTTTVGTTVRDLTGTGGVAFYKGYGDLRWTSVDGSVLHERSNGRGLFVQTDVPGGEWTRTKDPTATATSRLADPLRGLGLVSEPVVAGSEVVDGVRATKMIGSLPAGPEALALLGLTDQEIAAIGEDWRGQLVSVAVWIDDGGRIVRIDRALDLPDATTGPVVARTSTRLSDFSRIVDLAPPPPESVTNASE
jgi:hypothetical protein